MHISENPRKYPRYISDKNILTTGYDVDCEYSERQKTRKSL